MRQLTFPAIILPKKTSQQGRLRLRQKRLQLFEPHLNQPISTAGFGDWVEEQAPSVLAPIPPVRGANISNFYKLEEEVAKRKREQDNKYCRMIHDLHLLPEF
jgi:hypothetical protein